MKVLVFIAIFTFGFNVFAQDFSAYECPLEAIEAEESFPLVVKIAEQPMSYLQNCIAAQGMYSKLADQTFGVKTEIGCKFNFSSILFERAAAYKYSRSGVNDVDKAQIFISLDLIIKDDPIKAKDLIKATSNDCYEFMLGQIDPTKSYEGIMP